MGGDLTRRTEKFFSKIGHFQLAGVPDRAEPDRGEVNFSHLFHLVDALQYEGWIGCEYRPKGRTEEGLGWLQTVLCLNQRKLDSLGLAPWEWEWRLSY